MGCITDLIVISNSSFATPTQWGTSLGSHYWNYHDTIFKRVLSSYLTKWYRLSRSFNRHQGDWPYLRYLTFYTALGSVDFFLLMLSNKSLILKLRCPLQQFTRQKCWFLVCLRHTLHTYRDIFIMTCTKHFSQQPLKLIMFYIYNFVTVNGKCVVSFCFKFSQAI